MKGRTAGSRNQWQDVNFGKTDPLVCMVIGCDRKALYRSVQSKRGRGFCFTHKDHTRTHARDTATERYRDYDMRRIGE